MTKTKPLGGIRMSPWEFTPSEGNFYQNLTIQIEKFDTTINSQVSSTTNREKVQIVDSVRYFHNLLLRDKWYQHFDF